MESARLLNAIINTAIDGILTIDQQGLIESFNPAASRIFGYHEHEVIGRNVSILMPEPDRSHHDAYMHRYHRSGESKIIGKGREVTGLRKDGSLFPFRLAVSDVKYDNRTIYAGFIHDLTKERENGILLEKEKELNLMKSRFVSMASHEFRTPLSTIQLSAVLIEKYTDACENPQVNKHIFKIKNAVSNLTTILNDFLSLERLESGKVNPSFKSFSLIELSEEVAEEMQMIAKEDQNIIYHHTGYDSMVVLDPNLLRNCMINLISNAIKYSGEHTFIEFSTEITVDRYVVTIKDNGIGIPEEDQEALFQPFFRAHNTGTIPGTGLGLNIVVRYAQLMGGNLHFESKVNEGTKFSLLFDRSDTNLGS